MKKLLVSLLILGATALYFGQVVTTAVFTDVVNFSGNRTNNLFQTDTILAPGSPTSIASTATGATTTVTTTVNHYLAAGDTVVIAGSTSTPSIDGTWTVSSVTATTFTVPVATSGVGGAAGTVTRPITAKVEPDNGGNIDITSAQTPSTFATGHRVYRSPATPFSTISSSSTGNPTTITTSTSHRLSAGDTVVITGHTGSTPTLNGRYTVSTVPSATTFTLAVNVTAGGSGGLVYRVDPIISIVSSTAGSPTTVTTAQAHGLSTGDVVSISGNGTAALNSTFAVSSVTATTFQLAGVTGGGSGGGQVFKNVVQQTILASSAASPTTITTAAPHGLTSGDSVWITGHSVSGLNNTLQTVTVTGSKSFTIPLSSTGGTGGSIVRAMTSSISSSSAANPTVITTPAPHGLVTGDTVFIDSHSGGTTVAISSISATNPATVTTASTAGLTQGQQVTISGTGSIDGTWTATVTSATTFTIPVAGSGGTVGTVTNAIYGSYTATVTSATTFTIPVAVTNPGSGGQFYRVPKANIVSSSLSTVTGITTTAPNGTNTTVNTAAVPGLSNGQTVFISGNSNSGVNGTWVVSGLSGTQFTIAANTSSSGPGTGGSVSTGTILTTAAPHRLVASDKIFIGDHSGSTPSIAGQYAVIAAPTPTTLLLNVSVTVAGAGGTATGPWSQVGVDISPLARVNYVDSSPGQGVFFYTVRGYYSGEGATWESPNSNIVAASLLNDFNVIMPDPINAPISAVSIASPAIITTSSPHGLFTGDPVTITGSVTTPSITGQWTATVVDATHFTIPIAVTAVSIGAGTVERGPTVAINGSSAGNPTTITTASNHNLTTGAIVTIYGHTSTPDINGQWPVTVTGATTFTIPVSVDVAGTGGRIGDFDQTAGTNYTVTAKARTADGATMLAYTGASTLSVTSGQPGTLACTPGCSVQPIAGVITYTGKVTDAPTATTTLHVANNVAPVRSGDGRAFNVAPAQFVISVNGGANMKSGTASTVTATAQDAAGATLTTFIGGVTLANSPLATNASTITCASSCTQTAVAGVATYSATVTNAPWSTRLRGTYTAGMLTPLGDSAAYLVGPASFTLSTPATQTKDIAFSTLTATAKDSLGATATGFVGSVTVAPSVGSCTAGCTATAVAGVATFTGLTLNTASDAMTMTVTYTGAPTEGPSSP